MVFKDGKQQRLFVREVLIQGSNRYAGAIRYSRGGQLFCSLAQQNLNSRRGNRLYRYCCPRLNRRLSWLKYKLSIRCHNANSKPEESFIKCLRCSGECAGFTEADACSRKGQSNDPTK